METKCDQPQIAALSNALQVGIKTEYLDASAAAGEDLFFETTFSILAYCFKDRSYGVLS